jgi:hypothetical protein
MKLLVEAPLNPLSLGNVSLNIIREFFNKNVDIGLFPIGNIDFKAFDLNPGFISYIQKSIDNRFSFLKKDEKIVLKA